MCCFKLAAEKYLFFDLNELKCRLLAPRLAFQKLMQAPRGRQLKTNGNIVNVPADVVNTANMLPRFPNETSTIKVNLKRRLQYKSSALSLNVRPNSVAEAAKWLVNNGDLYKDEVITFNDTWLEYNSDTQMVLAVALLERYLGGVYSYIRILPDEFILK